MAEYVAAGFRKIHLDCSMACKGDPEPLPEAEIVRRLGTRMICADCGANAGNSKVRRTMPQSERAASTCTRRLKP